MNEAKGFLGAIVGGLIGAGVWGVVTFITHREFGMIAWVIGLLAGLGAALASGRKGLATVGIAAGVAALLSIGIGKFAAVHVVANKIFARSDASVASMTIDDDFAQQLMAQGLVKDQVTAGKSPAWPPGMSEDDAGTITDYPPDVVASVLSRWTAMSEPEREEYKVRSLAEFQDHYAQSKKDAKADIFLKSFSAFDLLWAFLAVSSAFKIGAGSSPAPAPTAA